MRKGKFLAGLVGGIIVLVAAGLLAVWLLVNPNNYKDRIAAAVKESTGRELNLTGDIKLSVFPAIALQLGPASLGNPPGFGEEPLLEFKHAAVRIGLWRLLYKQLDVQRVEIDGLDVRLLKDGHGRGNWEDFGQTERGPDAPPGAKPHVSLLELPRIRVTDGRVSYPGMVVEKLDLETGPRSAQGTPVRIGFDVSRDVPGETLNFNAQFKILDQQAKQLRLEGISLSGLVARPDERSPASWGLSASTLEVDFAAQTLELPAFGLGFAGARISGKLNATKILDDLSLTGSVALAPMSLRGIAPRFGLVLPDTRDARAFSQLSASGDVSYGAHGVSFDRMLVQLDDTHLKGSAALTGEPRALKFTLSVDQIDLDRYLSADQRAPAPKSLAEPAAKAAEAPAKSGEARAAVLTLPDAAGTLEVGAVHFSPLDFSTVRLTLASKDNVVHLNPAVAQIDGGNHSGNITLDNRGATPILNMDEHLSGVDMTRLLAATPYKGRLSGHGNVNLKATAHGSALDAVMQTLNGHFDASLSDGYLEGIDLEYELAAAQALIKHEPIPPRSAPARTFDAAKMTADIPSGPGPARTPFDAFKMSAEISSGVARTTDLIIASPVLRVAGQGSANLPTKAIDFQLLASLKASGATLADIPLKVTGTYVDPTVRPDLEALAKGELKQKLKDVLKKNGLQGLFDK